MKESEKVKDYRAKGITYELITIKSVKQEKINKIMIFAILAIVVIAGASISGIMVANANREKEMLLSEAVVEETPEPTPKPIIPIYSEEAKEKIKNIYSSSEEEKVVYLTFDDGPSSNITPQILDILKEADVKATFFVLGSRVEQYPELVKREYDEGHYIANHGYSHTYTSIYSSPNAVLDEYNITEEKIKSALGLDVYSSHLFRFPGGSEGGTYAKIKNDAKSILEENGISYVNWNALTNDAVRKADI